MRLGGGDNGRLRIVEHGRSSAPLHSTLPSMASVVLFSSNRNSFLVSIQELGGLQGAVTGTTGEAHHADQSQRLPLDMMAHINEGPVS